jgi:hypothetical protein
MMSMKLSRPAISWLVIGVAAASVLCVFLLPPLRQAQSYHNFADDRAFFGVPNFLNVISNVGFVVVGLMGLGFLLKKNGPTLGFIDARERWPYAVFFLGAIWIGFGSAYYHWTPKDSTLVWDRLPMTVAFMSVLAATICERISVRAGLLLLGPLVLAGAASAWYWRRTCNLWPYAEVQYASPLMVGLIILLFPPRYTRGVDLLWAVAIYAVAKIAEALDRPIFSVGRLVSGHTLKHLVAALALFWVLRMLCRRTNASLSLQPQNINKS